jgi:hypothetical protein
VAYIRFRGGGFHCNRRGYGGAGAGGGTGMIGGMRADLTIIILKPANEAGLFYFS